MNNVGERDMISVECSFVFSHRVFIVGVDEGYNRVFYKIDFDFGVKVYSNGFILALRNGI